MDVVRLARKNIRELKPYSTARDEFGGLAEVMLDANENPYNTPLNRYPDPHQAALKGKIAGIKGVSAENIFLGNGSDEAIDLLFRVFCEPGQHNAVSMAPSYGMYHVAADINNVLLREVLLNTDFSLDANRILAACDTDTRLIFLCSPNNPTGKLIDRESIRKICSESQAVVVVDEAYIDFSSEGSLLEELANWPNLVILQTFSKAWGLAGIRLGLAFAAPGIIALMNKVKYPYNINLLTMEKAGEALARPEVVEKWVKEILEQREDLAARLSGLEGVLKVWPSDANFLLVRFKDPQKVFSFLTARGIIVRDRSSVPLCEGSLRVTVGTALENNTLIDALKELDRDARQGN